MVYREKDIDEVLQTHTVFTNVSKGQVAKKEDLVSAFGKDDMTEICKLILDKGELQVSGKERHDQLESSVKDVANTIAGYFAALLNIDLQKFQGSNYFILLIFVGLCVNPDTKKPYPISIIEKGLKDIHFSVKPNRNTKQQALEAIPQLKTSMKIERVQMRIRINVSGSTCKSIAEKTEKMGTIEDKEFVGNALTMVRYLMTTILKL